MLDISRKGLIKRCRDMYATPEDSAKGRLRGAGALNAALAWIYTNVPERLLAQEWRFRLEKPLEGTGDIDADDAKVLEVTFATTAERDLYPQDGTLSARWIEIQDPDTGTWVQRRIRMLYWVAGIPTATIRIVMNEAWSVAGVTDLSYRIYTLEYPYSNEWARITQMFYNPDDGLARELLAFTPQDAIAARIGSGWRSVGLPTRYGRGSTFQMPTPHRAPDVAVAIPAGGDNTQRWGYDSGGAEHGQALVSGQYYEAAGTFRYYACLGWGRRKWLHPTYGASFLAPFYISAPAPVTSDVTTTWAGGKITLTLPDMSYVLGFGPRNDLHSFQHSGFEWWIYRARVATEDPTSGTNHAWAKRPEDDEIPYLLTVIPVDSGLQTTTLEDRGDHGPPDRNMPLGDHFGHPSFFFDRLPADVKDILVRGIRRPPVLEHDSDVPPVPMEISDLILPLMASILVSRRSNEPDQESTYYKQYLDKVKTMVDREGIMGPEILLMGNALSTGVQRSPYAGTFMSPPSKV